MKGKSWIVPIVLGLIMGGIIFATGIFHQVFASSPVKANALSDDITTTVLNSHNKWKTLQGDSQFIWYGPKGDTQTYTNKFYLSQPASVYVDIVDLSQKGNDGIWISDGNNIYKLHKGDKTYTSQIFNAKVLDLSMLPTSSIKIQPDFVYMHPIASHIQAPILEYIYSTWFAQSRPNDVYTLSSEYTILNRQAWVVDYQTINGDSGTAWIDKSTGIILQFRQLTNGKLFLEMKMTNLQVDAPIDSTWFLVPNEYSLVNK